MEPLLIPAVINVFYPRWIPLDLLCLHSSVLSKIPVTSIVPFEYVTQLPYCPLHKKSEARFENYTQIPHDLSCVCLFVIHPRFAHPCQVISSTQTQGPRGSAAIQTLLLCHGWWTRRLNCQECIKFFSSHILENRSHVAQFSLQLANWTSGRPHSISVLEL